MLQLLLKAEDTGYGTPKFGWIRAFGKERQVIVYNNANEINYVYVDAQPKKIIVSMAPKPGQIGGAKDHYNPEDSSAEDPNPVGSTIDSMEPVDEIIKLVKTVLEDPSL